MAHGAGPMPLSSMDTLGSAALASWSLDPGVIAVLLVTAVVYVRGWLRGRRFSRGERDVARLGCFLGGLLTLFLAIESPLDAFDRLFLSAHMLQHMLLLTIAPPLLLLGDPMLPLLRGLPREFVREGLGPFLSWPALKRILRCLTSPPVAWLAFAASTIVWHLPKFYEIALNTPTWHSAQHACFFWTGVLFWWPVVETGHRRPVWPRWAMIPYLLLGDILNTALSAFLIFSDRVLYPSYETLRVGGLSAREDQAAAGAIMWVPGSIVYIVPAIAITVRLFSGSSKAKPRTPVLRRPGKTIRFAQLAALRPIAQGAMLVLAIAVMWHGFFGPQVAALNLAGVLPWIHWRALAVLSLLLVGNLFCMACPFTLMRDFGRLFLPAKLRWPRWLRAKWVPAGLIVLYLWTYEAYRLWDSPWLTAWIIAGYFSSALLVDGIFRGASFCKYVCPIGQFHFVSSLVSPREIRVRSLAVCQKCGTHDCIRGNHSGRGCQLYLFQPKKLGNMDCTFCLDCVKACPHDNVGLISIAPATTLLSDPYRSSLGRLSKRTDIAALAVVVVFGAFVNAAGMVSPVMMWQHDWDTRLGSDMMPVIVAILVVAGVLILPALAVFVCGALNRVVLWSSVVGYVIRRFVLALVPVGFAMWAAHLLYHLAVSPSAIPGWLTPAQILLLDSGLLLTLYVSWRVASQHAAKFSRAVALVMPWAVLSCVVYGCGIWILFQPMQMRGMMH